MATPARYAAQQATHPGVGPYLVGLLYAEPPSFVAEEIATKLRDVFGRADRVGNDSGPLSFAIPEAGGATPEGKRLPYLLSVLPADVGDLGPSLAQSWDWPLARDAASRVRHAFVVTDLLTIGLDRKVRVDLLDRFLRAIMALRAPVALHWLGSERIVEPAAYIATGRMEERLTKGFVNVRLFRVEGQQPGECVMDTLGLASFGLPDLQCHFAGLDPGRVAGVLFTYAAYVFERGDVLLDGNTVEGAVPGSKWRCRHEAALVAPERVVIDLHPGAARPAGPGSR